MPDDRIVRCRNWMRKIIDAPNVDGWQNMVDTPDDDFTDPDFADDVDKDEIKRKDFDSRYPEYVKKVMLKEEKYQGKEISYAEYKEYEKRMSKLFLRDTKEISDAEYEEYERRRISKIFFGDTKEISDAEYEEYVERMSKNFKDTELPSEKKEKEPEDKTLKEKESYEEKQERYFKSFEAMQKKYPYLTDTEISEKLRAEKDKESYKDNNDLLGGSKKKYERMHGKNLDMQIKQVYKLLKNGTKFKTAMKTCKIPDSHEKYVINGIRKLKEKK